MAIILDADKGITYPSWTTAGRPAAPTAGQMGYNTTLGVLEVYNGSVWTTMVGGPWTTAGRPAAPVTGQVGYNTTYGGIEVYNGTAWSTISGGPAFNVYVNSGQSIATATETTVQFDTKTFDTANCYSTSTYRFTPTVAGYYQFNFSVAYTNNAVGANYSYLYKNGSKVATFYDLVLTSNFYTLSGSVLVYANGSTDYFYVNVYQAQGSNRPLANNTIWSGFLARGA